MRLRRQYNWEKLTPRIVAMLEAGASQLEISEVLKINYGTLRNWMMRHKVRVDNNVVSVDFRSLREAHIVQQLYRHYGIEPRRAQELLRLEVTYPMTCPVLGTELQYRSKNVPMEALASAFVYYPGEHTIERIVIVSDLVRRILHHLVTPPQSGRLQRLSVLWETLGLDNEGVSPYRLLR